MAKGTLNHNHRLLGQRIRSIRISQGYSSLDSFAYKHEMSRAQYARYENGMNIGFDNLLKLIGFFNMTPEQFFSEGFEGLDINNKTDQS